MARIILWYNLILKIAHFKTAYWLTDRQIVQDAVADTFTGYIHLFPNPLNALEYIKVFYETMIQNWHSLDKHRYEFKRSKLTKDRIAKYLTLLRKFTQQTFVFLAKNEYDSKVLQRYVELLKESILSPDCKAHSLQSFACEIFLREVQRYCGEKVKY